jgi:hypothetical protein
MKLRNKKTGEIVSLEGELLFDNKVMLLKQYTSLAELNEYWEDYEEPKGSALDLMILTLMNCIENEPDEDMVDLEDCKQMLEKLKAWKRLKGHNLRVERGQRIFVNTDNKLTSQKPLFVVDTYEEVEDDLDLLFEEE